ncbi:YdaS family helix-turn-helix protein [Escherichia sp. E1130]|uniref:transcriptional regulator n=1 Tax=Escherichia sp. E1130 TaxID=2041645 RepID=UPI001080EC1A|nr:YdaS family helix-turn-helix protein [Escherichia sp. E1130]TGC25308.1 Cro/Cl family transcriptional regulator [Escherichia sp. E1130]TLI72922.1 helix-turn-helix domain-containing protein [Escherichia sp. E1130]
MNEIVRSRLGELLSQRAISKGLGITPQAVNQWFSKSVIPPRFVLQLCELTGWKVIPHEIRPDLYPSTDDGLPETLRGTSHAEQSEV